MARLSQPVDQSQSLKAVLGVRELILSGLVRPGERLSEIVLSDRLGLSRTPLRAALVRLEHEGLLEPIPSGGYAVRGFTEDDVVDAIELRGVLEGTAVRLAAERGVTPAKMAAMRQLLTALDSVVDIDPAKIQFERYVDLNAQFHEMLVELCGSKLVARELARVTQLPFASPSAFLNNQTDVPSFRASLYGAQNQHKAIIAAIEMREGARAEALAREHARLARANLTLALEDEALAGKVPALVLVG